MSKGPFKHSKRVIFSFDSAADLTSNKYKGVRLFASNTVAAVGSTPAGFIGIQDSEPMSGTGMPTDVVLHGGTWGVAAGAFTAGAELMLQANTNSGALVVADSINASNIVGIALESATAASQVVSVFVNPRNKVPN